ncbi:MAG: cheB2 [Myxococcales bacterium]|nr:cheB2 [Myxococcales bacterium]
MGKRADRDSARRPARLVVIGASMGGVEALRALFAAVPRPIATAFVVVLHRSGGPDVLSDILARDSGLPGASARDGERLEPGRIYVAPAGFHTWIEGDRLRVTLGPRENGQRPAVDPLFRSAARSWENRAIGVVLSGALDCGARGLAEIKGRGGLAIVQDPSTAINPQMPESALDAVSADHVVPPEAIGPLVARLVKKAPPRRRAVRRPASEKPSGFMCPECNGPISEAGSEAYRCRVGHRYSAERFFDEKELRLENALWEALNVMQERIELSHRMAARARDKGHTTTAGRYESRAGDTAENAALLRDLIYRLGGALPIDEAAAVAVDEVRQKRGRKRARSV